MLLARIADARGQPDRAIEHLEQAVRTARAGRVRRLLANAEGDLADAYRRQGNLQKSLLHARAAVDETKAVGNRFTLPGRLRVLAGISAAQGRITDADRLYEEAADVVEGIMVNVPSPVAQARLVSVMSDIYADHFRLAAERLNDPAKAHQILERARGRAVADVLRTFSRRDPRPSPEVVQQMRTISRVQSRLMTARTRAERQTLLDQLWDAEQRTYPEPIQARVNLVTGNSPIDISSIRRRLQRDEVILEYVLSEPRSYCVVITGRALKIAQLAPKAEIEHLVGNFTSGMRNGSSTGAEAARALYDALAEPITELGSATRIVVVPDGTLHTVPFDSLFRLNDPEGRVVTVVPSSSVLFLLRGIRSGPRAHRPLLALGGVPYDRMFTSTAPAAAASRSDEGRGFYDLSKPATLPPLPSTEAEVQTAARVLGPESVLLTGDHATESALKAQPLAEFKVLHFAVHGYADPKFPERTALVLLGDTTSGEDGLLQPREISRLALNAGVVVLSACDTAVGPTLGQEGVLNLARAFLLAGARSIVTTLWTVKDTMSTAVMRRFYEHLAAGQDVAKALSMAKRDVLDRFGPNALPTVAAFQLVGVGDARISRGNGSGTTSGSRQ
jgi:CHAT domain-containing protein